MRPSVRRRLRQLHAIFGLAFGMVLLVVALSGAVLAIRPELEPLLGPDVRWDGERVSDWQVVLERSATERPGHRLQMIWFPNEARPYFTAAYAIDGREYTDFLHLHPEDGTPLERPPSGLMPWMEELHENLHLGGFGGWLVRWCTPILVGLLATGVALSWQPGIRMATLLRVRRGRAFLLDTHRSSGLLALPLLLLMAWTGAVWSFPRTLEPALYALAGEARPEQARSAFWQLESTVPVGGDGDADARPMIDRALAEAGAGGFVDYLSFPIHPTENRQVRVQHGYEPWPEGEKSVYYFDRYSGALLAQDEPGPGRTTAYLRRWNAELHFGSFGGGFTRALWFAACLALVHLAWSGVWLWARRHRRAPRAEPSSTSEGA